MRSTTEKRQDPVYNDRLFIIADIEGNNTETVATSIPKPNNATLFQRIAHRHLNQTYQTAHTIKLISEGAPSVLLAADCLNSIAKGSIHRINLPVLQAFDDLDANAKKHANDYKAGGHQNYDTEMFGFLKQDLGIELAQKYNTNTTKLVPLFGEPFSNKTEAIAHALLLTNVPLAAIFENSGNREQWVIYSGSGENPVVQMSHWRGENRTKEKFTFSSVDELLRDGARMISEINQNNEHDSSFTIQM